MGPSRGAPGGSGADGGRVELTMTRTTALLWCDRAPSRQMADAEPSWVWRICWLTQTCHTLSTQAASRIDTGRIVASTAEKIALVCFSPSGRSEEHTSELQSLMRISYAVFCLKQKKKQVIKNNN